VDEALFASWAFRIFGKGDIFLNGVSGIDKPPLLFLLQAISYFIFGVSENAARFPNFIAGLFTIFLTYKIGNYYFNWRTGWLAALLLAISSMHVAYSNTAFTDMLMLCLGLASIYFITRKDYFLAGVAALLSIASKQFGIIFIPLMVCLLGIELSKQYAINKIFFSLEMKTFGKGFGMALIGLLFFTAFSNPAWGFLLNQKASKIQTSGLLESTSLWFGTYLKIFNVHVISYLGVFSIFTALLVSLRGILMRSQQSVTRILPLGLMAVFSLAYFSFLILTGIYNYIRYALIWLPFVALVIAFVANAFFDYTVKLIENIQMKKIVTAAFFIVLVGSVIYVIRTIHGDQQLNFGSFYKANDGIERVCDYLARDKNPNKILLISGSGWGYNFYARNIKFKKKIDISNLEELRQTIEKFPNSTVYFSVKRTNDAVFDPEMLTQQKFKPLLPLSCNSNFDLYLFTNGKNLTILN
jgi:4-amino-4-deoxy-L-arabinose transferase-like glycosyltransferase